MIVRILACMVIALAFELARTNEKLRKARHLNIVYGQEMVKLLQAVQKGEPAFLCPKCGRVSFNVNDIANGYCGNCHDWTGEPRPEVLAEITGVRHG